jgi:hypothetical protein
MVTREGARPASAEQRLKELGIKLGPLDRSGPTLRRPDAKRHDS